jgi:predicted Zn-dependent protease with MMP-like domain
MQDGELDELLCTFEEQLAREDLLAAKRCLTTLQERVGAEHVEVIYAEARLVWLKQDVQAARVLLEALIALDENHADALYALGCIAEERGDRSEMVERFLRVRALDAACDKQVGIGVREHFEHIERVASQALQRLPGMFAERLAHVPVLIERRPSRALVKDGFDPRSFGLFEGPTQGVSDSPEPTRIVLFACNLLAAFPDEPHLTEQVEVTLLHEIGHFFGLDEAQLMQLGLG